MKCFQITLKSGQQVTVYTKSDFLAVDAKLWADHHSIDPNEVACVIEITQNTKNQTLYLREHRKSTAERIVANTEVQMAADNRFKELHPDMIVQQQGGSGLVYP